jgi:FixJ family two-component response regulator
VIFLTAHGDVPSSVHAMKHGAWDFLQKPVRADALFEAIESALARSAVVRRARGELEELRALASTLSEREREVWLRVVRGQLNKQIAYDLGIVERTVKLHRAAAMQKLRAASTADLVRMAHRLGLPSGTTDPTS